MPVCPKCATPAAENARFCAACGTLFIADATQTSATLAIEPAARPDAHKPKTPVSTISATSNAVDEGRFPPGTLLAGRYRVSGLLGRGGMGEVYRANDLALGQPVALKFLPEALARNTSMIARFYSEVRIARKVSHPNVCRVYDIGDVDGSLFISMEYVDGEDLGGLLKRIGRLPADKATEIARKLCAGLAAAHEKGILHRDLKPANIMLDRQGQVIIMDFGLAGLADQIQGAEVRNGTPAYMAPEQLTGREVTARSDIYSLGLVLYELYTGKRPFEASTLAELLRLQEQSAPISLSSMVADLDPAVERAIVKCLNADPAARPASALSVAASLPGGNALAEALAAGETPSPELVAASGSVEGMPPRRALLCFLGALAGVVVAAAMVSAANAPTMAALELSTDVLAHKAREIEAALGYPDRLPGSAFSFQWNQPYRDHLRERGSPIVPPSRGPDQNIEFWLRESPLPLAQLQVESSDIQWNSPSFDVPGSRRIRLDPSGDLLDFEAMPQPDSVRLSSTPVDWNVALNAIGLDTSKLTPGEALWTPTQPFDTRASWTNGRVRVEGAAWKGRVVWFHVTPLWQKPQPVTAASAGSSAVASQALELGLFVVLLVGAILLAAYNLKRNRGDRRSAMRIAATSLLLVVSQTLVGGAHVASSEEFTVVVSGIEVALLFSGILYLLYLAIEPWFRRQWPQALITWTRLTSGQVRDPLVGSDILLGVLFGLGWSMMYATRILVAAKAGIALPIRLELDTLLGGRYLAGLLLGIPLGAIRQVFFVILSVLLFRLAFRKQMLAFGAYVLVFSAMASVSSLLPLVDFPYYVIVYTLFVYILTRFGMVCSVTAQLVFSAFSGAPVTLDFSQWYGGASFFAMAVVALLAGYAFHTTLAGRAIFKDDLF